MKMALIMNLDMPVPYYVLLADFSKPPLMTIRSSPMIIDMMWSLISSIDFLTIGEPFINT